MFNESIIKQSKSNEIVIVDEKKGKKERFPGSKSLGTSYQ